MIIEHVLLVLAGGMLGALAGALFVGACSTGAVEDAYRAGYSNGFRAARKAA